jgi:DNA-binding FadR family transcriptional regulator
MLNRVIQDQIKQYITENKLAAGDLLPPEGQLASDLGVSRGSVREAIKALESLGIVEVRHGDGVRVRAFNFDSVFDLLSYGLVFDPAKAAELLGIRIWLEVAAVADADHPDQRRRAGPDRRTCWTTGKPRRWPARMSPPTIAASITSCTPP